MCNKRRATEPNNDIQHRHWLCCDWSGKKKKKQYLISFSFIYSFLGWGYKIHSLNTLVLFKNGLKRPPWKKLNHRLSLGSYQKALSQARPADLHKLSIIFTQIKIWCSFHIQYSQTGPHHWLKAYLHHFNGWSHNVQAISLFIIVFPLSLTAEILCMQCRSLRCYGETKLINNAMKVRVIQNRCMMLVTWLYRQQQANKNKTCSKLSFGYRQFMCQFLPTPAITIVPCCEGISPLVLRL